MRIRVIITIGVLCCVLLAAGSVASAKMVPWENSAHSNAAQSQIAEPVTIIGNPQLAQQSRGGVGTRSDPYILTGLTITSSGSCIYIASTTAFFVIRECELETTSQSGAVITLNRVDNGIIEGCYIRGGHNGIYIYNSSDCTSKDNSLIGSYNGIQISASLNCTVLDSTVHSNTVGVSITYSNRSLIVNNSIYKNGQIGLWVEESEDTKIYGNKLGWNGAGPWIGNNGNAYDDSVNTQFTNGIDSGNAWSDYNGSGDYEVLGLSGASDAFPTILNDTESPIIDEPLDKVFDVESTGETVTWTALDEMPYTYRIFINDIPHDIVLWDGRKITITLDALPEGTHRIEVHVTDAAMNTAIDQVIASAVSFMLGGIGTELVLGGSVLTVVIFILVIVIIKRMP